MGGVLNADGYHIWRKIADANGKYITGWESLADLAADTTVYVESGCDVQDRQYTYTVAAYQEIDGVKYWSGYDYTGVSGVPVLDTPEDVALLE